MSGLRRGDLLSVVLLPGDNGGRKECWSLHCPRRGLRRRLRDLLAGPRVQGRPVGRQEQGMLRTAALC